MFKVTELVFEICNNQQHTFREPLHGAFLLPWPQFGLRERP